MPGREEALERVKQWKAEDVQGLAQEFADSYGLDVQPKLAASPFGPHDGGHRFSNTPADVYGELLQNVADRAAMDKLYGSGAIHGNPASMRQQAQESGRRKATGFVNYGFMPDKDAFNERVAREIAQGVDPGYYSSRGDGSWDLEVARKITARQKELNRIFNVATKKLKEGDMTFFQGAGEFDATNGFMPSPSLYNTREIAPQDVNTARTRGESFADALIRGYGEAVESGRYKPRHALLDGMVHAADLSDAVAEGQVRVGRGWADEGIFPYQDRVAALSNPPAQLDPRTRSSPAATDFVINAATEARNTRALGRIRNAIRTGTGVAGSLAAAVPLTSEEAWRKVGERDYRGAARQVATEAGIAALASSVIPWAAGALQRVAPAAAPAVFGTLAPAAVAGLPTDAVKAYSAYLEGRTGKGLPQRLLEFQDSAAGMTPSMQAASPRPRTPRTAPAQTARQAIPQLFPTPRAVLANTPTGAAQLTKTQPRDPIQAIQQEARRRWTNAVKDWNPASGNFGASWLLLGR